MNNGRIWCVVSPTVGLPLFLGSVAVMAFTVHFAVLNNTTWFGDYWNGSAKKAASVETPGAAKLADAKPGFAINVTPSSSPNSFTVTITPKTASAEAVPSGGLALVDTAK